MTVRLMNAVTGVVLLGMLGACAERELILPGERFPVRAPLADSVPVEGEAAPVAPPLRPENRAEPISLPAVTANAEWTHRAGNARHQMPHGSLSAAPQRLWAANVGAGSSRRNRISAAPIVADGRIFTLDAKSVLVATTTGGARAWSVDLSAPFDRGGDLSGGGMAAGGGRVFAATAFGELVALDAASGGVLWRQRLDAPVTGAPAVEGDTVYVGARDGSAWAVEAATGKVRWQLPGVPGAGGMIGAAGPAIGDRAVLFPFASGQVTAALKVGGTRIWSAPVVGRRLGRAYAAMGDVTGDPVIAGGTVFVGTSAGRTVALSLSGEEQWAAVEGALGPVLAVGGSAFIVNDEARLMRLDAATGEVIWAVDMPYFTKDKPKRRKAVHPHFGPVLAGGRLVVASGDGLLRLFDPVDGSLVGTADLPGGAAAQPALAGGVLYVLNTNGQLLAFR